MKPGLAQRVVAAFSRARDNAGRVGCWILLAIVAVVVLRGCVGDLAGEGLPDALEASVMDAHVHCESDFPIWPGEVRMPTCDQVTVRAAGAGRVPPASADLGITRALCYHVDTEQLYWGEGGTWKHDMAWALRTYSKVAVLKRGEWILFPDEDEADRARWAEYDCPGEYEATSGLVPRKQ